MAPISLNPIGIAHSPFHTSHEVPRHGAPATNEIFPAYRNALDGIDSCSHIWIIGFFHNAARDLLQARPRKSSPSSPPRGVFSMRSPVRPNPLGLTCARLLERQGSTLLLDRLDFQDKTPVVDIKPYSPGWDLILSASGIHRYDPSRYSEEELLLALQHDAANALGPSHPSPARSAIIQALASLILHHVDIRSPSTHFAIPIPDERVDLLMGSTAASFGNQRLHILSLPDSVLLRSWTPRIAFDVSICSGSPQLLPLSPPG